jgi:PHD/YefM family antitoxin component YafN of YafNO toxin-antitoxin module
MNTISYTASNARKNLYTLIKTAAAGLNTIEINLRHTDPVVMMSKSDYDSWLETLDIMSNSEEIATIRRSLKSKTRITHLQLKKKLGL